MRGQQRTHSPVPPTGEAEMRQHLGVWGKTPAGVQRAAPFGAVRIGRLPGEGRESRGQRPLVPAAEAIQAVIRFRRGVGLPLLGGCPCFGE